MFRVQTRTLVFFVFVFFFFAFFPHRAKIQPPQMQFPFCLGMSPKEPWKVNPIKGIEKRETKKPHRVCWRAALFVGVQVRVCALYWRICFFFPFFFFATRFNQIFTWAISDQHSVGVEFIFTVIVFTKEPYFPNVFFVTSLVGAWLLRIFVQRARWRAGKTRPGSGEID